MRRMLFFTWALAFLSSAASGLTKEEAARVLPDKIASFRAFGPPAIPVPGSLVEFVPENFGATSEIARAYTSDKGHSFLVEACITQTDSGAYALLAEKRLANEVIDLDHVGIASIVAPKLIRFAKGNTYLQISQNDKGASYPEELMSLARTLAETIDRGEGDIPSVIKHLPDWQTVQPRAGYSMSLALLQKHFPEEQVLEAVSFVGGAEAATAHYDAGTLVIVEFTTPQLATANDGQIQARLQELRSGNRSVPEVGVPTAYRRVGNYAVFVFNGQSEQAANQLIDQIKYEQVVRWLGNNPHLFAEAQREYTETTLGILVSVVKASGLALLSCLAVGGFLGALLFSRRRAQERTDPIYSDAGGMMRLNLDELTPQTDPARLIGPGGPVH